MFCSDACVGRSIIATFMLLFGCVGAEAHDAPTGWSYPPLCCSGIDCRPVASSAIKEGPAGYVITSTGELVPYRDKRVRNSPDGEYHWCSMLGEDDTRTICLFVPPRSY